MQSMAVPSVNRQWKFASLLNIHCSAFFSDAVGILQTIFNVRDEIWFWVHTNAKTTHAATKKYNKKYIRWEKNMGWL